MRTAAWVGVVAALAGATLAPPVSAQATAPAESPRAWALVRPSTLMVDVERRGLFSPFLHDHHLVPKTWTADFQFDPARPAGLHGLVTVDASTLRDRQPKLSAANRAKVEAQVRGPDVLDVARYPRVELELRGLEVQRATPGATGSLNGYAIGTLRLHGRERPVKAAIAITYQGDALRAVGELWIKQTDYGIKPYSTGGGTVGVEDKVVIRFDVNATRRAEGRVSGRGA